MYITSAMVVELSTIIAAVLAIGGLIYTIVKWIQKQEKQSEDIEKLNAEMAVISTALLACLDGLKQLGANGKVTEAHDQLEKHLNQRAHGQK